jgi:hypothetical protein
MEKENDRVREKREIRYRNSKIDKSQERVRI